MNEWGSGTGTQLRHIARWRIDSDKTRNKCDEITDAKRNDKQKKPTLSFNKSQGNRSFV